MNETLNQLRERVLEVAGQWNGEDAGRLETKAQIANEIVEKLNEVEKLINELEF